MKRVIVWSLVALGLAALAGLLYVSRFMFPGYKKVSLGNA